MEKNFVTRFNPLTVLALLTVGFATPRVGNAAILAPYLVDTNTLHLYHLDDSATPVIDSAAVGNNLLGLLNGATLGNASYSGFGTAVSTWDGGQNAIAATNKDAELMVSTNGTLPVAMAYMNPTTSAFTYETLVRIDFDPAKNLGTTANGGNNRAAIQSIIMGESAVNSNRIFQFRIEPIGVSTPVNLNAPNLSFINVSGGGITQSILTPLPTNGPDAIVSNSWYHVAVTYNGLPGTVGNLNLYWTLVDPTRTNASLLASATMNNNLVSANIAFSVGNIARSDNGNFLGLIDEVRLSDIARAPYQMLFGPLAATVIGQPVTQAVGIGQSATFSVGASGAPPLTYQWRFNSNVISGATSSTYSIPVCQFSNSGSYDVIVSNSVSSMTSSEAALIVRTPLNLTWLGLQTANWDTTNATNWLDTGHSTNAVYSPGDDVTFDANGSAVSSVNLVGALSPNAIIVNANNNYTFTGGSLTGIAGLSKSGSGRLILDVDSNLSGPVSIQGGAIQLGQNDTHGSLGSAPAVTNNGGIIISRTSSLAIGGNISGSGGLTNIGTGVVTLSGSNSFTGSLIASAGGYVLDGTQALGSVTNIALTASANSNGATTLSLSQSVVLNPNITLQALGTSPSPDFRVTVSSTDGTNLINGPMVMTGNGSVQLAANGTSELDIDGPVNDPGFIGKLVLRGASRTVVNTPITISGALNTTDTGLWLLNSSGNTWTTTLISGGTLRMGAAGVLPATVPLTVQSNGVLDLAGFNQQTTSLSDGGTSTGIIGSSSASSDCVLTINSVGTSSYSGLIIDSLSGGTRRVGITVTGVGNTLVLGNTNVYSGSTVVTGGTLQLSGNGNISNSTSINLTAGGTLSASSRSDGTFRLNAPQTLLGDGAIHIQGNVTVLGTVQLKLNKAGAVLSNDSITNASLITYGGTLSLTISGNALVTNDAFRLFSGTGYSGEFTSIIPAAPGAGLMWNTNTLTTDGILRVAVATVAAAPKFSSIQLSGTNLIFGGTNGNPGSQFDIVASTNITTPLSNWVSVLTSSFDGSGNFSVTNGVAPGPTRQFFTIRAP